MKPDDTTGGEPEPLLKVVELGSGYAASFAGLMLARCGAEVVKIESQEVESLREAPTATMGAGNTSEALFDYLNDGKLSVALRLNDPDDEAILADLWGWAEVIVADQPWLSTELLSTLRTTPGPAVIVAITPFGLAGPYAGRPANDASVFAMAGESSMLPGGLGYQLFPDAPPLIAAGHIAEADAGVIAATICLAGAIAGAQGEMPTLFDVSVLECETSLNRWLVSHFDATGWIESRATRAYSYAGLLKCRDGYVMMQPTTDAHWNGLVAAMEHPGWADRVEWATQDGRSEDGAEITERLAEWASLKTKSELLEIGLANEVPIAPFLDVPEVVECEQFRFRNYFVPYLPVDEATVREVPGMPFQAGRLPDGIRRRAPQFGEDTERIRQRLKG
jgi:crotonobetainyl-CoA:carnitine CoA-transferase CaiB-like acyl-CoA transferase